MTACIALIVATAIGAGTVGLVLGCVLGLAAREDADAHSTPSKWRGPNA